MKLDAIFFGAHPDDVELSCGGTVVKLINSGKKVGIIDLTAGELGTRGSKLIREKETQKASRILNISLRKNLNIKDGNIQNNEENRIEIIKIIREYKPAIIFFPHYHDRHPDHQNANYLIKEGAFFSGLPKIITKLGNIKQESYRPVKNYYFMQTYTFEPSFIIDISGEFNNKMKAVKCYSSQFYNPKSNEPETFISDKKFMEFLEARAVYYGFQIGVKYGEPYYSEEKIKFDINNLFNC